MKKIITVSELPSDPLTGTSIVEIKFNIGSEVSHKKLKRLFPDVERFIFPGTLNGIGNRVFECPAWLNYLAAEITSPKCKVNTIAFFTELNVSFTEFSNALKSCSPNFTTLHLSHCNLFNNQLEFLIIANGLKLNKTITYLDLSYNGFEHDGGSLCIKKISEIIEDNETITHLDMSGSSGVIHTDFQSALGANKTITHLTLHNCVDSKGVTNDALEFVIDNESITHLDLCENRFNGDDLSHVLSRNNKVTHLYLADCSLTEDDIENLVRYVFSKPLELVYLDLSGNTAGDRGSILLGNALSKNDALTHLVLSNMKNLTLGGMLQYMSQNRLISLTLENNNLTTKDVNALVYFVKHNKTLVHLNLKRNKFVETDIAAIKEALGYNTTLKEVLFDNKTLKNINTKGYSGHDVDPDYESDSDVGDGDGGGDNNDDGDYYSDSDSDGGDGGDDDEELIW